jgi:hypothetical protein
VLTGVVTNAATGNTLEGARVVVKGTSTEVYTDSQGVYRITGVSPGEATLSVSYTGLTTVDVPVIVRAGARMQHDVGLTADIYQLSTFVVSGEREGNAQAITLQRPLRWHQKHRGRRRVRRARRQSGGTRRAIAGDRGRVGRR